MCVGGSEFFLPFTPRYCGFPWNSWSHHLSLSDPNLMSGCYKTKITSHVLAVAVLSREHSQVFVISLCLVWMDAKLPPLGFNLETDEKSFDQVKLWRVWSCSSSSDQCTGLVGLMSQFSNSQHWWCGLFGGLYCCLQVCHRCCTKL